MKRYWGCDGCNKMVQSFTTDDFPAGWLSTPDDDAKWMGDWPWAARTITACSSDCVSAAKENKKRRAREALARFESKIDAVKLVRT